MNTDILSKQEYMHLVNKVNNNSLCVEYFRKSLFNSSFRGSRELQRNKTIYEDDKIKIQVNRSLNQKHRDLLSLLMFEDKDCIDKMGGYHIYFTLYDIAKKMKYKNPNSSANDIKKLLYDLSLTQFSYKMKNKNAGSSHNLISDIEYVDDIYRIYIHPKTSRYHIYSTCVSIPQNINEKIVAIENSKSRLKALVSFMLSNTKLKHGIYFDTICDKLDITERTAKIKFKKQVNQNLDLLKEFKIKYENDKFYLKKEKCTFYSALTDKQVISFEKNEKVKQRNSILDQLLTKDKSEIITIAMQANKKVFVKNTDERRLAFFNEDEQFNRFLSDEEVDNLVNFINQKDLYDN